jgi:hypothetical protein
MRPNVTAALFVLTGAAAGWLATGAAATDAGMAAANQVSQASYTDFLDNWLYTHAGDDRGFGPEHDLARDNIEMFFVLYGLDVELHPFQYQSTTYYNVVGTMTGTVHPDQEYIVGAHYDSVNNPGADDDASGTALVLEAARILSQYDSAYTIRFMAFDREEQGLIGSSAYVADHAGADILGMVQADMVAYNTGANSTDIYAGSAGSTPLQVDLVEPPGRQRSPAVRECRLPGGRDHRGLGQPLLPHAPGHLRHPRLRVRNADDPLGRRVARGCRRSGCAVRRAVLHPARRNARVRRPRWWNHDQG